MCEIEVLCERRPACGLSLGVSERIREGEC